MLCLVCGLWSAGATRWDSENFEDLVDNVWTVGLGFLMDNSDSGDSGSLTGMRCAEVSRTSGIILTTTTTFCRTLSTRMWCLPRLL